LGPARAACFVTSQVVATMVVVDQHEYLSEEEKRLKEDRERKKYWKKWYTNSDALLPQV